MSFKDILLSLIIGSLIIGGSGVFIWYKVYVTPEIEQKDQLNKSLNNALTKLQENSKPTTISNEQFSVTLNFYPETLFSQKQRDVLLDKYFLPMQAFYNETSENLKAILVEETEVTLLLKDRTLKYAINFSDQNVWQPVCLERCDFTNTFFALYPEIVEAYAN